MQQPRLSLKCKTYYCTEELSQWMRPKKGDYSEVIKNMLAGKLRV